MVLWISEIKIHTVDPSAMESLINYAYTGTGPTRKKGNMTQRCDVNPFGLGLSMYVFMYICLLSMTMLQHLINSPLSFHLRHLVGNDQNIFSNQMFNLNLYKKKYLNFNLSYNSYFMF